MVSINKNCGNIFSFLLLVFLVNAQRQCPSQEVIIPCRCHLKGEFYQIWCSHSDLPKTLKTIKLIGQLISEPINEIVFENNYLPSLPGRTFQPLKIVRLMSRYNGIERVSNDFLEGLQHSLMELFIVEPQLKSLPPDIFIHLVNIEAITLKTKQIKRLPLINNLPKLKYLHIEMQSLSELSSRNLKNLKNLERFHLLNCPHLKKLENNLFVDLPNLNLINISYCGIDWVHPHTFMGLPNLRKLLLIGNNIKDGGMIGRAIKDLENLEYLSLDNNNINKINEGDFVDIKNLKKLYLANNKISELKYGSFHRLPNLKIIDLNNNNIKMIHPESFLEKSPLQELWLVNNDINHIYELQTLLNSLPELQFLDLSFNYLESIPFGALRGHPTLERLHLDYNKINYIEREAFMGMPALRELRLKNNSLFINKNGGPWWNLPSLKGLDLSGNFLKNIQPNFLENLPNLRRIYLNDNNIKILNPSLFLMTPNLEYINLSNNLLSTLHPATFRHLLNLYELDLGQNNLIEFVPGLPRGLENLYLNDNYINDMPLVPSPDIDLPFLRILNLSKNNIKKIPRNFFKYIPQLKQLDLSNNNFNLIDQESFINLKKLEILNMENNQINKIMPNSFSELIELKELNLNNNKITIFYDDLLRNNTKLGKFHINQNQLLEIPQNNKKIQIFDASFNNIVQFPLITKMDQLKILNLNNNQIKELKPIKSLINIEKINLSKNFLFHLINDSFSHLYNVEMINLEYNSIEIIESNAFKHLPNLKIIKLGWNKIKNLPINFVNLPNLEILEIQNNKMNQINASLPKLLLLNATFNQFTNLNDINGNSLEVLDLSNNKINKIDDNSLINLKMLIELIIDDNLICAIDGKPFNLMPRLRILTMKNNKITIIYEKSFNQILNNIALLDINGNPLNCDCNLLWLQTWYRQLNQLGPKCFNGLYLKQIHLQDCHLNDNNNNYRSNEFYGGGCENELILPQNFTTSQVFSSKWTKLTNITNLQDKRNNLPPLPEESEYFYDDYVDYPFNETIIKKPASTTGNTPTIYAATSKNKTSLDVPKEVVNSPSTSGFTFFGVPLKGLNFANILNTMNGKSTKKTTQEAERKMAIVNNINKPPLTIMQPPPPNPPAVEIGGFKPILPGTGGFKPIPNPNPIISSKVFKSELNISTTTTTTTTTIKSQHFDNTINKTINNNNTIDKSNHLKPLQQIQNDTDQDFITPLPKQQNNTLDMKKDSTNKDQIQKGINLIEKKVAPLETALLIPGGQQPEFRGGKSTIIKIESPFSNSSPLISSLGVVNDPLPHRVAKHFATKKTNNDNDNDDNNDDGDDDADDMNWYFANYNNSKSSNMVNVWGGNCAGCIEFYHKLFIFLIVIKLYIM